jgi:hypothetical protein
MVDVGRRPKNCHILSHVKTLDNNFEYATVLAHQPFVVDA